jgi:hypothetical protein
MAGQCTRQYGIRLRRTRNPVEAAFVNAHLEVAGVTAAIKDASGQGVRKAAEIFLQVGKL